jgi:hypothetical protein
VRLRWVLVALYDGYFERVFLDAEERSVHVMTYD